MSDWQQATLGEFVRLQRGHDLTEAERSEGTIPVIGSAGQNGWHGVARCKGPGVTVGRSGASAGVITYVPQDYWPHNTVLYVTDFLGNDPLFAAFMLRTLPLAELNSGSAQPSLNRNFLYHVPVSIPPLETQRRIAGILAAYDNLIEVNRRRIAVLEKMAQGLFTEWFIRLRFPGYEEVSIEGTPDGPLPTGWTWGRIGDVAAYVNRGIAPKYDDAAETMVIGQKCIRDQRLSLALARKQSKNVPQVKIVRPGDVLINSTGTGTLGRVAQAEKVAPGLTVDSHVTIVRPSSEEDRDYLGLSLFSMQPVFEHLGVGSTSQTELSRSSVESQLLIWPPIALRARFGRIVRPMRELIEQLAQQNETLATARDLLLPRLISGQLSVSQAEQELEAA